jgi:hypothetical protein
MSYRNDQFFNIRNQGDFGPQEPGAGPYAPQTTGDIRWLNKRFLYPTRSIGVVRPKRGESNYGTPEVLPMKRGYIRTVDIGLDGEDFTPIACQFQFNPQYLSQTVSFTGGTTHPMYQQPSQLNQPAAVPTNVAIQLLFDRSWELNGASKIDPLTTSGDIWEKNGPEQIGVFHDISALFRVIGQGISESTSKLLATRAQEAISATVIGPNVTDMVVPNTNV